jgi:alkaline phosphatase D
MLQSFLLLALAGTSLASYGANLNYRSPSNHHPGLGISIRKVVKRNDPSVTYDASSLNFTHGVASGDPYFSSVILWTRCSPMLDDVDDNSTVSGYVPLYNPVPIYKDTDEGKPPSKSPVCLNYVVATDQALSDVVDHGTVYTSSDVDYTVKVEATGLDAFTYYYYQFSVCNSKNSSPIGRTKTTPAAKDDVSSVSLAIYSCSNFPFGFFNAYGNTVRKDSVDYVVHLGDYIYEYKNGDTGYGFSYGWGNSIDRIPLPDRNIFTLYDYRKRHASYKTDADLQLSQQNFPWIPVWDDHGRLLVSPYSQDEAKAFPEVADNTYRDGSADLNNTEDSFIKEGGISTDQRKMNAVRAYFEWMPIR